MAMVLKATALEFKRKNFQLGPLDLAIEEGIALALIGPNGSGKTTLISCLMGLSRPDGGSVALWNKPVDHRQASWKESIGVVLGEQVFYESLSVDSNLQFFSRIWSTWDHTLADRLLNRVNLSTAKLVKNLSKGERQKLAIVLALSHRPKLLVADEATAGLDPVVRNEVTDMVVEMMREDGMAVLMATQLISDVAKISDQVAILSEGQLKQVVNKDELLDAWRKVSFQFGGSTEEIPGAQTHVVEGLMHLVVTSDIRVTMSKLKSMGATQIEINPLALEEITVNIMKGDRL
jgi:ABC-2 type transport system ATP-binding protein